MKHNVETQHFERQKKSSYYKYERSKSNKTSSLIRVARSPAIRDNITPKSVKVEGSPEARITQFLVQVARGCFLYVKMVLDLLERGHLVIKSSSFNVLPLSLAEIFLLEFNLKFPSARAFQKVRTSLLNSSRTYCNCECGF